VKCIALGFCDSDVKVRFVYNGNYNIIIIDEFIKVMFFSGAILNGEELIAEER